MEKKSNTALYFAQRAVIYKNSGKSEQAEEDYRKALKLCRDNNCINIVKESYKNYKIWYKEYDNQTKIEYSF